MRLLLWVAVAAAACTAPPASDAGPEGGDEAPGVGDGADGVDDQGGEAGETPAPAEPDEGALGGPCFPNNTCAGGLICNADTLCEAPPPVDKKDFAEDCDSGDACPDTYSCQDVTGADGKRCVPTEICAIEDRDGDGIADDVDNCVVTSNADQANSDGDPQGDACDNCPEADNADQADCDGDTIGDACDEPCPFILQWARVDEAGPTVANDDHTLKTSVGTRIGGLTVSNEDFQISLKVQGLP